MQYSHSSAAHLKSKKGVKYHHNFYHYPNCCQFLACCFSLLFFFLGGWGDENTQQDLTQVKRTKQNEKSTSITQDLQSRTLLASLQIWFGFIFTPITRSNRLYSYAWPTHRGRVHSWRLHILRMGFGFLLASQKLRWTILLSLFLRHPYFVYWNPGKYFRKIRKNRLLLEMFLLNFQVLLNGFTWQIFTRY